ncbi:hypothetical protein GCM10009332_12210 [Shewanella gelidii]|uniref:Uncharacterized protein n=1 Tax=Shewanella gelidii TaxID=1642821 RepID=A0A917N896_9GAMM|nr:hypothetical protein GCM10009332_12210 [Shewanella gelidii]
MHIGYSPLQLKKHNCNSENPSHDFNDDVVVDAHDIRTSKNGLQWSIKETRCH